MFTSTTAGRLYKGKTHGWTDAQDRERTMYRGRYNYRDPRSGKYHWIDAVCFNDFGNNGGLVSFLEENFSGSTDTDNGGDAVILVGYIRPTDKKQTVKVDFNTSKGKITKEVPNIAYSTFEFVIEEAYFPPKSQGEGSERSGNASLDVDDETDFEDLEVTAHEEEDEDDVQEEAEETEAEKKKRLKKEKADAAKKEAAKKDSSKSKSGAGKSKAGAGSKKPTPPKDEDEDDDFFDDEQSA